MCDLAAVALHQIEDTTMGTIHELKDRKCGDCSACCTVMAVDEIEKPDDKRCQHLKARGTNCCRIYDKRPLACRAFKCGWLEGLGTNSHRPDKMGVIIYAGSDAHTNAGLKVIHAREVWPDAMNSPRWRHLEQQIAAEGFAMIMLPHGCMSDPLRSRAVRGDPREIVRVAEFAIAHEGARLTASPLDGNWSHREHDDWVAGAAMQTLLFSDDVARVQAIMERVTDSVIQDIPEEMLTRYMNMTTEQQRAWDEEVLKSVLMRYMNCVLQDAIVKGAITDDVLHQRHGKITSRRLLMLLKIEEAEWETHDAIEEMKWEARDASLGADEHDNDRDLT